MGVSLPLLNPSAIAEVTPLQRRKTVSKTHNEMSSWLKALFILGPHSTAMARTLPTRPRTPIREEARPFSHHFHSWRIWKRYIF